jgi:nitrogen fixation/metabolism regulation signal transduction histidine kinase
MKQRYTILMGLLTMILIAGCGGGTSDDRIHELSRQAMSEQARQNERVAEQHQQIAEAARQLVVAEGEARRETLELQRELASKDSAARQQLTQLTQDVKEDLSSERAELDRQREGLETERRVIAAERYWEPVLGQVISSAVLVLVCAAPLVLCWLILFRAHNEPIDDQLNELLISQLVDQPPRLPSAENALTQRLREEDPLEPEELPF